MIKDHPRNGRGRICDPAQERGITAVRILKRENKVRFKRTEGSVDHRGGGNRAGGVPRAERI